MDKVDLKKEWKPYYGPSAQKISFVDVPMFSFLSIEGIDARPDSPDFTGAIQALFSLSYKVKFASKKQLGRDYAVMPLEAFWWADDMDEFVKGNKEKWRWTLLIRQPEWIDGDFIDSVRSGLKDADRESGHMDRLVLEEITEGPSAQILYIGPFSEEGPTIERLHEAIKEKGGRVDPILHKHHEIYLSDFRKTAPEKLRTVIRQSYAV
jgi:hypothetical protein